jgi:hypothetical protein
MKTILGLVALFLNFAGWFAIYETAISLNILSKPATSKSTVSATVESNKSTATVISDALFVYGF